MIRRALASICACTLLATIAVPAPAQPRASEPAPCAGAPSTCNEDQTLCCSWWYVDTIVDGRASGGLLEPSYEKLARRIENDRAMTERLCKYWGGSECRQTYGAPRCSGQIAGAAKQVTDRGAGVVAKNARDGLAPAIKALEDRSAALAAANKAFGVLAKIEKFINFARTVRDEGVGGAVTAMAASHLEKVRSKFEKMHRATGEYAAVLKEAVDRVRALRSEATACIDRMNPFAGADTAPVPARFGFVPSHGTTRFAPSDAELIGLWNVGGGFGGHVQQQELSKANEDAQSALSRLAHAGPQLPRIENLRLDQPALVVRREGARSPSDARVIFAQRGTLDDRDQVDPGEYPILGVAVVDGDARFADTRITRTETTDGERIVIETSDERVELKTCSQGREFRGTVCKCPENRPWDGKSCACEAPAHWNGRACITCAAGTNWTGEDCIACPPGEYWINSKCEACSGGRRWDGQVCACPAERPKWNGKQCLMSMCPVTPAGQQ